MGRFAASLLAVALVAGCAKPAPEATLAVRDAWIRLAAVPGRPAAAYFTVTGGAAPARLVAVESAEVATIELHEGGMKDGMMTMRRIEGVDVPANGEAVFRPGGNHAMLFGVAPSVQPGGAVPLVLRFADGQKLDATAKAIAAGDDAPAP